MPRYAIFYSPRLGSPLNQAANLWLGRDVITGAMIERPSPIDGMKQSQFDDMVSSARRYGFHGTLKAPFELAEGHSINELEDALAAYCTHLTPFTMSQFKIGQLGRFFALLPSAPSQELNDLASALVRDFDAFRAPLNQADIARRNPDKLSASQRDNLLNWGYPHIFENFRFHMTLTDPVPQDLTHTFKTALNTHFSSCLNQAPSFSALSLFIEPERGAPFLVKRQFPIG
ncbi:DUF1045 domain-containing protein [Cohaesibacter celericrescens]|uniref:Phosphonate metabolism protein n=1 Tax=Cohaesibacter celericrescens TaxID=2067669 RepID=A0A2N5XQX2_9HYPH|nr:DUF1045 domain-containing protein [Cohaesibacter celericrescens]PLW76903.1 hypothetical protein C0081_12680 [Cohaesibacter celericrescens]